MKVAKVEPKPEPVPVEAAEAQDHNPVFSSPVAKPAAAHKTTKAPDTPEVAKAFPDQTLPSMGSSAIPTLRKPREEVQTGGFGDPNGVPANGKTNRAPNIAARALMTCPPARQRERNGRSERREGRGCEHRIWQRSCNRFWRGGSHGAVQQAVSPTKQRQRRRRK